MTRRITIKEENVADTKVYLCGSISSIVHEPRGNKHFVGVNIQHEEGAHGFAFDNAEKADEFVRLLLGLSEEGFNDLQTITVEDLA